jgi:hypothetical protein
VADKEITRSDLTRDLVVNAATKPLNVVAGAGVVVAGIVIGETWLIAVGVVVYALLAVLTFFDSDEASAVGKRAYGKDKSLGAGARRDLRSFDPAIAEQLDSARRSEDAIAATIAKSDLPFGEVGPEVADLGKAMDSLAERAQRIYDYLNTQDPAAVQRRLAELQGQAKSQGQTVDPGVAQAVEALGQQSDALAKLASQVAGFHAKMEGIVASLGAINAEIVRLSVASEGAGESDVADKVRSLREQVDAASEGLKAAYSTNADAPSSLP